MPQLNMLVIGVLINYIFLAIIYLFKGNIVRQKQQMRYMRKYIC